VIDQVSQLAKAILYENNYKKRVQKILEFVQNYINKEILKMEYLFENGNEENQGKYVDLKRARTIVNNDINTLTKIVNMMEQIESMYYENKKNTEDVNTNVHVEHKGINLDDLETSSDSTEEDEVNKFYEIYSMEENDLAPEFDEVIDDDDDTYGFSHKRKNGKH
jgi:hypothetical protein